MTERGITRRVVRRMSKGSIVPPVIGRYRWPLGMAAGLAVAVWGGVALADDTVASMDPFYTQVAARDADRAPPAIDNDVQGSDMALLDNLPPVTPPDYGHAPDADDGGGDVAR